MITIIVFEDSDRNYFSGLGWKGSRTAMIGRFFVIMKLHLAEKAAMDPSEIEWPEEPEPEPEWIEDPTAVNVAHLDDSTFDDAVSSKSHAMVMFYAPWCGHCTKFKPDYAKAATLLADYDVTIAAVNAIKSKKAKKQFNVTGFPTILYFNNGKEAGTFEGDRSAGGLFEYLAEEERLGSVLAELAEEHKPPKEEVWSEAENDVEHLTDDNFASAVAAKAHSLVMFYAPWCGHCKHFKPEYEVAAGMLKATEDTVQIAAVDATIHRKVAEKYDVKGFPTTLYFANGEMTEKFEGERTSQGVITFMQNKVGKSEL